MSRMDTIQPSTTGRHPQVHRGRQKVSLKSGETNHEAPSTDLAITLDHVIEPPAGQLLRSSRHPLRARKYVVEHRERKANKRESSIPGMKVKDPISIVKLRLTKSEMDQVIAVSKVLAVHGRDDERILTRREYLEWVSKLAKPLFIDLLKERLRPKK
jgi:hypothetical protein